MPQINDYYILNRSGPEIEELLRLLSTLTNHGTTVIGHAPKISEDGYWLVWDENINDKNGGYVYTEPKVPADLSQDIKDQISYSYAQALEASEAQKNQILVANGTGRWDWKDFTDILTDNFMEEEEWEAIKERVYNRTFEDVLTSDYMESDTWDNLKKEVYG